MTSLSVMVSGLVRMFLLVLCHAADRSCKVEFAVDLCFSPLLIILRSVHQAI